MSETIEIQVNGNATMLDSKTTLAELVQRLNPQQQRIAVEVNREIIPKSQHSDLSLKAGDSIEIITAVGGG